MFHDFDQKDDIYRSEIKIPTDLSRNTNPLLAFQIQYQPPPPPPPSNGRTPTFHHSLMPPKSNK